MTIPLICRKLFHTYSITQNTETANPFGATVSAFFLESILQRTLWANGFGMLVLVSVFGFVLHGLVMPDALRYIAYCVEYFFMTFMLCAYVIAIHYDLDGERGLSRYIRICSVSAVSTAILLAIMKYFVPKYAFGLFSAYCAAHLLYCVIRLFRQVGSRPEFKWYLASIFVLIAASIVQSIKAIEFSIIWTFNYNAVYHFIELIFILLQFRGVRTVPGKDNDRRRTSKGR